LEAGYFIHFIERQASQKAVLCTKYTFFVFITNYFINIVLYFYMIVKYMSNYYQFYGNSR
jgi:hypothetical protein